jgi:hypothetical protein
MTAPATDPTPPACALCGRPATWFAADLGFCAACEAEHGLDRCLRLVTRADRPAPDNDELDHERKVP